MVQSPIYFLLFLMLSSIKILLQKPKKPPVKTAITINPNELKVWMIGHATLLINFYGSTILTDPVFVDWIPIPRRMVHKGYEIADLPPIDLALVSHAHMDHLNKKSLSRLGPKIKTVVIPRNCIDLVKRLHLKKVKELDWGQSQTFGDLKVSVFRAIHWGERYPWENYNRGYNSYIIEKNGKSIFFCGDSAYGEFFKNIGNSFNITLALLPIGAYKPPALRRVHMGPHDAVRAFMDLDARHMVPIHWGNFRLALERPQEPPLVLAQLASNINADAVHILANGESVSI